MRPVFVKTPTQILKRSCTQDMLQSYNYIRLSEAVARRFSVKKVFLEILQNSQESTCARDISKNTFFYRTPPATVSGLSVPAINHMKIKIPYLRHHKETLHEKRSTKNTFLILPISSAVQLYFSITAQKIKFSIKDFFGIHIY